MIGVIRRVPAGLLAVAVLLMAIGLLAMSNQPAGAAGEGDGDVNDVNQVNEVTGDDLTEDQRRSLIASFKRPAQNGPIDLLMPDDGSPNQAALPSRGSGERVTAQALGRQLFFDKRLSKTGQIACASCHNPDFGWESPLRKPVGVTGKPLARHTPTLLGVGAAPMLLWDGAAASLERQAYRPLTHPDEMAADMPELVAWLGDDADYAAAFRAVFGEAPSPTHLMAALAAFQRRIWPAPTGFDRWVEGDKKSLSPAAERGFYLFNGRARCAACHAGWLFTDRRFHDIGLATTDLGRAAVEPDAPGRRFAFKTPTLRRIKDRAPYMHDGSLADLRAVITHYRHGGVRRPSQSPLIEPLNLSAPDIEALLAFLKTL